MRISLSFILTLLLTPPTCLFAGSEQASPNPIGRWSEERARVWYKGQPWLVGCNFIPSTAINQLEMWQKETFDPDTIDRELGWAADIGFNIIRVYLHDMLWQQDPSGFVERIDRFLTIANKRDIKVMFVLLDSCWNPFPKLGPQPKPKPHVHNSGWVQSPHIDLLKHADRHDKLKGYVKSIVSKYGNDDRIIMWDIYNEPGNRNGISYGAREPANKDELALALLKKAFAWVREVDPTQPVTAGVYMGQWHKAGEATPLNQFMLNNSDVITFHCYDRSERIKKFIQVLRQYNRPIICTEYMSRGRGCTVQSTLPLFKQHRIGAINWGLVAGKTQTQYPWDSWTNEYMSEPELWFHDIFRPDGTPFSNQEIEFLRKLARTSDAALKQYSE